MMTVRRSVGRLAEVLFRPPMSVEELSAFVAGVRGEVQRAKDSLVFVCDWRTVERFESTFSDTIVWTMRRDNPRIAANGVLVGESNLALFEQVEKVLREAKNPNRKVFRARADLAAFLDPLLTAPERTRRDAFLDEGERPPSRR
jgi:hypothetical protein